jgi:hypothetical protein
VEQPVLPVPAANLPASQLAHSELAGELVNLPDSQAEQSSFEAVEILPAAHCEQVSTPEAE